LGKSDKEEERNVHSFVAGIVVGLIVLLVWFSFREKISAACRSKLGPRSSQPCSEARAGQVEEIELEEMGGSSVQASPANEEGTVERVVRPCPQF
jgi:hypothetical protein